MKRILNNFAVNFVALLCQALAVVLSAVHSLNGNGILWGAIALALFVGLVPTINRLHRINRERPPA
jgi:hypothetical protein